METGRGYAGLLNIGSRRHFTIFFTDFEPPLALKQAIEREVPRVRTQLVFMRLPDRDRTILRNIERAGADLENDYVSMHVIASTMSSVETIERVLAQIRHGDMASFDLPLAECGFRPRFATPQFRVVAAADYAQQKRIAALFFDHLERRVPYEVVISSGERGNLRVCDDAGWFAMGGRLRLGEHRTLPGGEVAYTGANLSGTFVVDGAILATPQTPSVAKDAHRLALLGKEFATKPLRIEIQDGLVTRVAGAGKAARVFTRLFEEDARYRTVTEVGISFNRSCRTFRHTWHDGTNEGRPGVHLGLGGDPDLRHETSGDPLVHIDLMAANSAVIINGRNFLRASS